MPGITHIFLTNRLVNGYVEEIGRKKAVRFEIFVEKAASLKCKIKQTLSYYRIYPIIYLGPDLCISEHIKLDL